MMNAPHFYRHLKKTRGLLILTVLALLFQAALTVLLPLPIKFLIDRVLVPTATGAEHLLQIDLPWAGTIGSYPVMEILIAVGALLVVLTGVVAIFDRLEETLTTRAAQRVVEGMRNELLSMLMTRRHLFLESRRKIDLMYRISGDTGNIEILITEGLSTYVRSLPTLLFIVGFMLYIDLRFSILLAITLPLMYVLTTFFSRRVRNAQRNLRKESKLFDQDVHQMLAALPLIKSLTIEPATLSALEERTRHLFEHTLTSKKSQGSLTASLNGAKNLVRAVVVLIGGAAVLHGDLTIGGLTLFLTYIEAINKPINELARFSSKLSKTVVSVEQLEELYEEMQGQEETEGTQNISSLPFPDATTLHFENVGFGYEGSRQLIDGFSAEFHTGELIALVGPSGVGKSTLSKLMNRLLDPVEGRILIGKTDIRRFRLRTLRNTVTVVYQDPFFVHGTIRENLLLAAPHDAEAPDDAEISSTLHDAACEFVNALPKKLDTVIGEGGLQLSGGQAKRLNLARALLRGQSQIFVFDEPTSGLDPESAQTVFQSIRGLTETGAIVFWVTHRMEEVPQTDRVIFFQSGARVAVGAHVELMRSNDSYRRFFQQAERAEEARELEGEVQQ